MKVQIYGHMHCIFMHIQCHFKISIIAKQTELLNIYKQEKLKRYSKTNTVMEIQAEKN